MTEQLTMIAAAGSALGGIAILTAATLKGWQGWLELKRLELSGRHGAEGRGPMAERIEMADLKERIRKLESIAACVDL
ncbi:MAG TPA: hypothetical protein VKI45_02725 [Allosphingosinicella sp.]|jgi:trehalose-6-phosphatase|nr:hypothetical protein [Allosphingosinicella sp.]